MMICRKFRSLGPLALAAVLSLAPGADGMETVSPPRTAAGTIPLLTRIADVYQVPRETDYLSYPVDIEGVVIFTALEGASFFFHDGEMGIHVFQPTGTHFQPGNRVRVVGDTRRGRYAPSIVPREVIHLGQGTFPARREASFAQLASGSLDGQWIELEGVVTSVSYSSNQSEVILDLSQIGGHTRAVVVSPLPNDPQRLLDCEVRIRGVATGRFNQRGQMIEPLLAVPGSSWITTVQEGPTDPFLLPIRSVSRLLEFSLTHQPLHRAHVRGVVTRQLSSTTFFIRDEGHGLKVELGRGAEFHPGDIVEAAGFPIVENDEVILHNALSRTTGNAPAPAAIRCDIDAVLDGSHATDLVTVQAYVTDVAIDGETTVITLRERGRSFKALLRDPLGGVFGRIEINSVVAASGICIISAPDVFASYQPRSFLLVAGLPEDVRVVKAAPWWTAERLWRALLTTIALLVAGVGWVWALQRQVKRKRSVIEFQTSRAAVLEERSRIARDLHDTLEQALTGVSLELKGVATDLSTNRDRADGRLQSARDMLRECRAVARNAIAKLRVDATPVPQDSLAGAVQHAADIWNRSGAMAVSVNIRGAAATLPAEVTHNLAGIVTEALTNAVKHGRAPSAEIIMDFAPELLVVRVADTGKGFDPATARTSSHGNFGLVGMRERAQAAGAELEIRSHAGNGTVVSVKLKLPFVAVLPVPHQTAAGKMG